MTAIRPWMKVAALVGILAAAGGSTLAVVHWADRVGSRLSDMEVRLSAMSSRMDDAEAAASKQGEQPVSSDLMAQMIEQRDRASKAADSKVEDAQRAVAETMQRQRAEGEQDRQRREVEMLRLEIDRMKKD